jgi:hypothetical protein
LDIAELKNDIGDVVHVIVKMRNPWSTESYHGPWRDMDINWTPEWKSIVHLVVANDGIFWMKWDTFVHNFFGVGAALIEDGEHEY